MVSWTIDISNYIRTNHVLTQLLNPVIKHRLNRFTNPSLGAKGEKNYSLIDTILYVPELICENSLMSTYINYNKTL